MKKNPCLMVDAYKLGHYFQMPPQVTCIYSTWTARSGKHSGLPKDAGTVVFGHAGFIREYLIEFFNENFFKADIDAIEEDFRRKVSVMFHPGYTDFTRFRELHKLGYLPITVMGVPEGTLLPHGVPDHVIHNTRPEFAWLPQYLEDIWSCHNWQPSTSATTAYYRRKLLEPYVQKMCDNPEAIRHICGDFSMRGMTGEDAAYVSTCGHLLSFDRTATLEGNAYLEQYYGAELVEGQVPGLGVPSLEHSVVCQNVAYYKHLIATGGLPDYMVPYVERGLGANWEANLIAEMCFMLRLLIEVQPTGMLTYVSDTYDYWGVVSKILPVIKDVIFSRAGCFSIRPDSGDPVKIICGDPGAAIGSPEWYGTLAMLKEIFGTTVNKKGYHVLDSHIRMIYGDAITADITEKVCGYCESTGLSIENIAFGIGAFTYQYVTRDTHGYAIKATDAILGMDEMPLYKSPKTDPGKKSPKGAVAVVSGKDGVPTMIDHLALDQSVDYPGNLMVLKFKDGVAYNEESIYQIRDRLWRGAF